LGARVCFAGKSPFKTVGHVWNPFNRPMESWRLLVAINGGGRIGRNAAARAGQSYDMKVKSSREFLPGRVAFLRKVMRMWYDLL
jgi:hypothetical protein